MGLDRNVVRVATDFYGSIDKYMISGPCTGRAPISLPRHPRLLQGCPLSVAALNAVMVMWLEEVAKSRNHCENGHTLQDESRTVYVDDRATLGWGTNAVENRKDYLEAAERMDQNMGFKTSKDKFKMAVSDDQLREKGIETGILQEGHIKSSVKILGIVVYPGGDRPPHLPDGALLRAERRCSVVGILPGTAAFRARLLRAWALSPAVWAAGHAPPFEKEIKALQRKADFASGSTYTESILWRRSARTASTSLWRRSMTWRRCAPPVAGC